MTGLAAPVARSRPFPKASAGRKELVLYAGLYAASAGLLKLGGFVLFLWMARTLSVEEYAAFGLSYALQTGLSMIALAGIVETVIGLLNEHRSDEGRKTLFSGANVAFALMAMPVIGLALLVYVVLVRPDADDWLTVACAVVSGLLTAFATLQSQLVRLQEKHSASLSFSFLAPLIGLAGGSLAFAMTPTVQSFFLGTTVGIAGVLAALRLLGVGSYGLRNGVLATRSIVTGIGPFIAIAVIGWLNGYGNNYIVQLFFDPTAVARLTFVLMVSSIMPLTAAALNQVWSPRFFRLVQEVPPEVVESGNRRFFRYQSLALGLAGGALVAVFPVAMRTLGGNLVSYESMRVELLCMVAAYVILSPWWHCFNYYLVHSQGREAMRLTLATSVVGVVVWIALMGVLGPVGIYVGFLTQMLIKMVAIVVLAKRRWPVTIAWDGVAAGLLLVAGGYAVSTL